MTGAKGYGEDGEPRVVLSFKIVHPMNGNPAYTQAAKQLAQLDMSNVVSAGAASSASSVTCSSDTLDGLPCDFHQNSPPPATEQPNH